MKSTEALLLLLLLPFSPSPILAQTVTITEAPSIPSDEPSFTSHDSFTSAILNSTNTYRSLYNATSVRWNSTLASFASDYLSDADCHFAHSGGPYGENLAEGYPNATASVEGWGNEVEEYSFKRPGFSEETGHFTQLVWKATTDVGCAASLCGTNGWFLACEYWPRGNVEGEYKQQVQKGDGDSAAARLGARTQSNVGLLGALWAMKELFQWLGDTSSEEER